MELKIIQTNDNGMFGGTYLNDFEYVYNNTNYRVKIEQYIMIINTTFNIIIDNCDIGICSGSYILLPIKNIIAI